MSLLIRRISGAEQDTIRTIAQWMQDWWGKEEGYGYDAVLRRMQHSMKEDGLPQTYGLFLDGAIIGMYQFMYEDLFVRPDLYPWLANLYIDAPYRKQGYGRMLLQSVEENARTGLPYDALYLFTEHTGLYEKYGWEFLSEIDTFLLKRRIQRLYRLDIRKKS